MSFKKRRGGLPNSTIVLFTVIQKVLLYFHSQKAQIKKLSFEVLESNVAEPTLEFSINVTLSCGVRTKIKTLVLIEFDKIWKYYGQRENCPLELEFFCEKRKIASVRLTVTEDFVINNYKSFTEEMFIKDFLSQQI